MNSKILYFSICVVALGIVGGLSYGIYERYRSLELVNEELRAMFSSSAPGRNATKFREAEFRMEGLRMDEKVLLMNEVGDTVSLSEVIGLQGGVLFRYSGTQCGACVDQQIQMIKDHFATDAKQLIIVADFQGKREIAAFRSAFKINYPVFREISRWETPLDALHMPYYVEWGQNKRVIRSFVPQKEQPELTEAFFGALNRKYGK